MVDLHLGQIQGFFIQQTTFLRLSFIDDIKKFNNKELGLFLRCWRVVRAKAIAKE